MKILIIEDEIAAASRLKMMLLTYDPNVVIEGPLDTNSAVQEWFKTNEMPDLIFSDIELLDGPIFEALRTLQINVPIVFTTAYDHYTLNAFDANGISYLLKPFEQEQINTAFDKFKRLQDSFTQTQNKDLIASIEQLYNAHSGDYKKRFNVKLGQGIYLLNVEDIVCIQMQDGIPFAFKANGKKLPLSGTIQDIEKQLNPTSFYLINRGELVNIHFISKIQKYFNDRLAVQMEGLKEPLISSAARTPEFRKWLNQ